MKSLKNLSDFDLTVEQQIKVHGKGYCENGNMPHITQDEDGHVIIEC